MRYITLITVLLLTVIISNSCKQVHYRINASSFEVNISIKRFEKDLFSLDPGKISTSLPELRDNYRDFLQLFSYVTNTGDINDPSFGDLLLGFSTDRMNNEVYDSVMKVFPDLSSLEEDLEEAYRNYLYYMPGKRVPSVFTCITGFNDSIITGDSVLGIGLDRYLGSGSQFYRRLEIYRYLVARMTPEYILPDCMYGWALSEWDFPAINYSADNVITEIIHEGKLKYFEKCMLPGTSDELLFGFTSDQLSFCRNNESRIWEYLIEHNLLFSTDWLIIRKLMGEAPFTSFFTDESPGRAAVWIGFRIVESYMMKTPGVSMEGLMKDTDIQGILNGAEYAP